MKSNEFTVKFEAEGLLPKNVKHNDLIKVLQDMNQMFRSIMLEEDPSLNKDELDLRIVSIEEGSVRGNYAVLGIHSDNLLDTTVTLLQKTMQTKDGSLLPKVAAESLNEINRFQKKYQSTFRVNTQNQELVGNTANVVFPEQFELYQPPNYQEFVTVYAHITSVGGKNQATTKLELIPTGEYLTADISNFEVAMSIANYLYRDVIVEGIATWSTDIKEIEHLKITGFVDEFQGNPQEGLDLLKKIVGPVLDEMDDPDAYFRSMRE